MEDTDGQPKGLSGFVSQGSGSNVKLTQIPMLAISTVQ